MNYRTPGATGPASGNFTATKTRLRPSHIRIYHVSELFTEGLIYALLIASPWAFGTTQISTMWWMNLLAFSIGSLFLLKTFVRWISGYRPVKWGATTSHPQTLQLLTRTLAVLTAVILAYCLIAALNARSAWNILTNSFDYFHSLPWLPRSYDRPSTWQTFWNCLAFACVFWAGRDWLLGLSSAEEQSQRTSDRGASLSFRERIFVPTRLRRLLWILTINGALLGVEGIAQRASGTNKLLWFMPTYINKDAIDQFGPWAYRANAAQYFNLLWPVTLGFWWMLHRSGGFKRWRHHVLLLCGIIMAACPIISTTRGGALITVGLVVSIALFLFISAIFLPSRRKEFSIRNALLTSGLLAAFFVVAIWLGLHFGWDNLQPRMTEFDKDYAGREQLNETARQIARDYPLYGTGPGTFTALYQLYRNSPDDYWPAQLHNDWLETRITWGWLGSLFIALALILVLARWFVSGGIHGGRRFVIIIWLAMAGCMAHARFDFPFQIYSIVLLFVTLCAVLSTLSRRV